MSQLLKAGSTVQLQATSTPGLVQRYLGGGGQGEVYVIDTSTGTFALKWYFPAYLALDPTLRGRLENAIRRGAPSDRFLWPLDLTFSAETEGFGYIMPLREARFRGLNDLLWGKLDPKFRALATAGFELSHAFYQLHIKGLCYQDISPGNVFFDPQNGDIRVCDNDNVDVDGQVGAIRGTPRFVAPEIVRLEATPSTLTDLFSLAILLFHILMIHHPLLGRRENDFDCLDPEAYKNLLGTSPIFIFDPRNTSNAPLPGDHDTVVRYWSIYPKFLQDLFVRAFTEGLRNPSARIVEGEWRAAMLRLRDSVLHCAGCLRENFYDIDRLAKAGVSAQPCWACGRSIQLPPRLRLGSSIVMLNRDTELFGHHLDTRRRWDFSAAWAAVVQHPQDATVWGLRNLSPATWMAALPDGSLSQIDPGRSVTLIAGLKINFGNIEGEIRT